MAVPQLLLISALLLTAAQLTAAPAAWEGDGVPAPEPCESSVQLGVYIFPGWYRYDGRGDYPYRTHDEDSEWRLIARKPAPRPLLGFYDDSLPEVNDWHIKWALDHGISFFCFDWYWNAGEHRLMRTLEQGFLKAEYCNLMKFCIHWCNHGLDWKDPQSHKPAAMDFGSPALVEMVEYMAENYFKLPNYLTMSGRPVVVIWDWRALFAANGGPEGFARALEEMNKALNARGLPDLYLVAMGEGGGLAEAGFGAFTGYGYYGTDFDSKYEWRGGHSVPYADVVTHYETTWKGLTADPDLPYVLAVGSNWDSRPRHNEGAAVIAGKTPQLFEDMCRRSLKYIDKRTNMAIIEAWNEWGEGSFIEPDKEWGFDFLDAVRRVYATAPAEHIDYVPTAEKVASYNVLSVDELAGAAEMEKQPYPDPPPLLRTVTWTTDEPLPAGPVLKSWEFDGDTTEGWWPYHVEPLQVRDGILSTRATLDDPQIVVDGIGVPIADIDCVALRLKTTDGVCEVFWATDQSPQMSADKALRFRLVPDGEWHTYQIRKQGDDKWQSVLKLLRLDIGDLGSVIEVDWVRLYGAAD